MHQGKSHISRLVCTIAAIVVCATMLIMPASQPASAHSDQESDVIVEPTVIDITENGISPASVDVEQGANVIWRNHTDQPVTLTEGAPNFVFLPTVAGGQSAAVAALSEQVVAATSDRSVPSNIIPAKGEFTQRADAVGDFSFHTKMQPGFVTTIRVMPPAVQLLQVTPDTDSSSNWQTVLQPVVDPHSNRDGLVNFAIDLKNVSGQQLAIRELRFSYRAANNSVLKEQVVSPDQMVDLLMSLGLPNNPNPDNWSMVGKASLIGKEWADFLAGWQGLENQGFRILDIETYVENGVRRYDGLFTPATYDKAAIVGQEWSAFLAGWQDLEGQGFRIFDIESYVDNNKRFYIGLFKPAAYAKAALVEMEWASFLAAWQDLENQGMRMIDMEIHESGGKTLHTGLFAPATYTPAAIVGKEWNDFFAGWQDLEAQGFRLFDMETYQASGKTLYAGLFKPANYAKAALVDKPWVEFVKLWGEIEYQGLRMIDIETRTKDGQRVYSGVFAPGPALNWFAGKRLLLLSPQASFAGVSPSSVRVTMKFDNWSIPWTFNIPLKAYANKNPAASYPFPARQRDLGRNQYWFMGYRAAHEGPKPELGPQAAERTNDAHRGAIWDSLNEGNVAFGQHYAYDVAVLNWDGSKWRDCDPARGDSADTEKCDENKEFYIWNTPIYAMEDGVVLYCYRSAAENPSPGVQLNAPGVPGGGNMFWIQHTGGEVALYAHMMAGSVSTDVCPTDGVQSDPKPTVIKGKILGRAGNSGSSSAPHLHFHIQATWKLGDKGEGMPILFTGLEVSERLPLADLVWRDVDRKSIVADGSIWKSGGRSDTLIKLDE